MGKPNEALDDCERALALDPTSAEGFVVRGLAYKKLGRLADARADYDHALQLDRDCGDALCRRGMLNYEADRYLEAVADLDHCIELKDVSAMARGWRGLAYAELGKMREAEADLARAEVLDPRDTQYPVNRGWVLLELGRPDAALDAEDRALAIREEGMAHVHRADALLLLDRPKEAEEAARRAVAGAPSLQGGHWAHGVALLATDRWNEGIQALAKARAVDPGRLNLDLLLGFYRAARKEAAIARLFEAALGHGLRDTRLPNNVAWRLIERPGATQFVADCAVRLAEGAVKLDATDGGLWNTLGVARYRAGDDHGTLQALNESIRLGNLGGAWDYLFVAMAHQRLGEHEDALRSYQQAIEKGGDSISKDDALRVAKAEAEALLGTQAGPSAPSKSK